MKSNGLASRFPFKLGVAVESAAITNSGERSERALAAISREFAQVTAENLMKPMYLQPAEGVFDFAEADRFVDWALSHDLAVVGHVLVWHQQLPDWFDKNSDGTPCSRETLIARMERHIETVVTHFKGRVYAWDVVNEAFENDGSLRDSPFCRIIGLDFIDIAFAAANRTDPNAQLWYNDYGNEHPGRHNAIMAMARRLKSNGIRIDGIGMQTHIRITSPDAATYERAIADFASLGLKSAITEFDMSVLPNAWELSAEISTSLEYLDWLDPFKEGLPAGVEALQAERMKVWFDMFRRRAADIDRVTVWGLSDSESWLNDFPVKGRTDYPLLFDRDLHLKPWAKSL